MITDQPLHGEKIIQVDSASRRLQAYFDALTGYVNNVDFPYTVATVPDATLFPGRSIYVTDAAAGATRAYSDGTVWRINQTTVLT